METLIIILLGGLIGGLVGALVGGAFGAIDYRGKTGKWPWH